MILVALSPEWIAYRQVAQPKISGAFFIGVTKTSL
jgi:hypothetical protein